MSEKNYTELLLKVTSNDNIGFLPKEYENIKKIIEVDILNFLKIESPMNSSGLYFDFKYQYEKMVNFFRFKDINQKQIIALGGGFSTGKSSFVNAIMNSRLLPSNLTPTTAVPTYVISGKNEFQAVNLFDSTVNLEKSELKLLTHDGNDENLEFGHLLKHIFVKSEDFNYENIAFLDTPGYSAYNNKDYSERTDEDICRSQLNSADYIFWFLSAEGGTISNTDIKFLETIDKKIPVYIVVNKCDKVTSKNLQLIYDDIENKLNNTNLNIKGIFRFTRRKPENFDLHKIDGLLKSLNIKKEDESFSNNFLKIFKNIEQYYENQKNEMKSHLNRLNTIDTMSDLKYGNLQESMNSMKLYYKNIIGKCDKKVEELHCIWRAIKENLDISEQDELKFTMENNNIFSDMLDDFLDEDNDYAKVVKERRYWRD